MFHRINCYFLSAVLAFSLHFLTNAQAAQTPGTWRNVTPHALDSALRAGGSWGGVQYALADPVRKSDLWVSADCQGVWRSTDYGLTWTHINTGANAASLNNGRPWSQAIDMNPNRDSSTHPAIYTTLGYGSGYIWKSTDGGINWTNVWNNNIFAGATNISADVGNDVARVQIIGADPNHLFAYLHSYWGTGNNNGIFESTDGGGSWIDHTAQQFNFQPHADGALAIDGQNWLAIHGTTYPNTILYRTSDGGSNWNVGGNNIPMASSNCMDPLAIDAVCYLPGNPLLKTSDKGATIQQVAGAGIVETMCRTVSNHLYVSSGDRSPSKQFTFRHCAIGDDAHWTDDPIPNLDSMYWGHPNNQDIGTGVPYIVVATYDGTNAIVVSANFMAGIWRYVEPAASTEMVRNTAAPFARSDISDCGKVRIFSAGRDVTAGLNNASPIYDLHGKNVRANSTSGRGIYIVKQ